MNRRIRHLKAQKPSLISELIASQMNLSEEAFQLLLEIGAIYQNEKRCSTNQHLLPGDIIRIHLEPKRFRNIQLSKDQHVHFETADFIIANKPKGIPSGPSLDNSKENLLFKLCDLFQQQLWLPHRLDIGTSGLICLGKNKEFSTWFSNQLEKRSIQKIYKAKAVGATLKKGTLLHWMRKSARSPKILSREPVEGWLKCELEILNISLTESGFQNLEINLGTGRTHQIRAQLGFEGAAIVGDELYGSSIQNPNSYESFELHCQKLGFFFAGRTYNFKSEILT